MPDSDDLALVRLELETLWVTDAAGRMLRCRTADGRPAPLLVVAACSAGICWTTSAAVPAAVRARIGTALAAEPPAAAVGWAPRCADALIAALSEVAGVAAPHGGPSYLLPRAPTAPTGVDLRTSATVARAALRDLMPEADRATLVAPWAVAMADGRVASVCETARSSPRAVEAGLWTYEPYRRRGLGAAATAAWAALAGERTAFYSTSWDNRASQGVAGHLGSRPLGQWWQLSRVP